MRHSLPALGSILMLGFVVTPGCSSSSSEPGSPAASIGGATGATKDVAKPVVDTSKLLVNTTQTERASLCDWTAALVGGYGKVLEVSCDGGTKGGGLTAEADQTTCVAGMAGFPATCTMTVGAFEGWVLSIVNNPCTYDPPADYTASSASCEF